MKEPVLRGLKQESRAVSRRYYAKATLSGSLMSKRFYDTGARGRRTDLRIGARNNDLAVSAIGSTLRI
jgi:hypothetical protein